MRNKKGYMLTLAAVFILSLATEHVIAQPIIAEEVRLSKLTLSAFECSLLAGDNKEAQRLFNVGFVAGRSFLRGIGTLTREERTRLSAQMDLLWQRVWDGTSQYVVGQSWKLSDSIGHSLWGPTIDFILGRVFSERAAWAYKISGGVEIDDDTRNVNNGKMYRERNCSLIHYHTRQESPGP